MNGVEHYNGNRMNCLHELYKLRVDGVIDPPKWVVPMTEENLTTSPEVEKSLTSFRAEDDGGEHTEKSEFENEETEESWLRNI